MDKTTLQLRQNLVRVEAHAKKLQAELEQIERSCEHCWGKPMCDPEYQEAHIIPGDKPGTMGVDWRPEQHVPAKIVPRWKRTCDRCGMIQTTKRKRQVMDETSLAKEVPDFGNC